MTIKKLSTLVLTSLVCIMLLASCGPNKKERTLQDLEQQQQQLNQQAKDDQLQANNLTTDAANLDKESKADSSKSQYEKDQANVLNAEAQQNLSKAASLDAQIEKAKSDATE
ncbi:conserved hypothetical protein [Francisella tularensis subsp. novicida GA99-3548]|uniref:hypothetical protein n=1 Tax=Francisella tularensis TaxID=263 RepID=UPI000158AFB5|nr:hypothetical protein [Francisella tularensis]AJI72435.1 hypothetical protein AQ14_525 [Francisella tularensis subsp. novicida D9876]EDN37168.1 conserved hypothetical protein [Francisella tularensis subsp. novicida GA99-3548]MBK2112199.1 hypothetical protein [Francisella tularensis subsp. novicida FSC159]